jgi:hypothetical protein
MSDPRKPKYCQHGVECAPDPEPCARCDAEREARRAKMTPAELAAEQKARAQFDEDLAAGRVEPYS